MTPKVVEFLEIPQVGKSAKFVQSGQYGQTSLVVQILTCSDGTLSVHTQSGSVYNGPILGVDQTYGGPAWQKDRTMMSVPPNVVSSQPTKLPLTVKHELKREYSPLHMLQDWIAIIRLKPILKNVGLVILAVFLTFTYLSSIRHSQGDGQHIIKGDTSPQIESDENIYLAATRFVADEACTQFQVPPPPLTHIRIAPPNECTIVMIGTDSHVHTYCVSGWIVIGKGKSAVRQQWKCGLEYWGNGHFSSDSVDFD